MNTEDKRVLSTIVLGVSRLDCIMHDDVPVVNPVFSVFDLFCASNIQFHVLRNAAVYQTNAFRREKRKDGTEQQQMYQDLVVRRVIVDNDNVEFISINGVFLPCTNIRLEDFTLAIFTSTPYQISFSFSSIDISTYKNTKNKIFHNVSIIAVEAI